MTLSLTINDIEVESLNYIIYVMLNFFCKLQAGK